MKIGHHVYKEDYMSKPTIVSHYICGTCNQPIIKYEEGFHIQGNITLADPNSGKGIIGGGSWLGKIDRGERLMHDEVPETVLCKNCFCKALGIVTYATRSPSNPLDR